MKLILFSIICILFVNICTAESQYSIEQFLNIRGAGSPQYSHDNSKIYFTQNITGTSQLWMMEKAAGWPFQITYHNEPVSGYNVNPVLDMIAYTMSEGGSEYDQIYLINGNGTGLKQITNNPNILYGFGQWSDDGSFFTYYSNERRSLYYDIYRYNIYSNTSELLHSSDFSNYPQRVSPDGRFLVFKRGYTNNDEDLFLLNLQTNKIEHLTPHLNIKSPAEYYPISFTADSRYLYVITNQNSDFRRLARIDIVLNKMEMLNPDYLENFKLWDLSGGWFSRDKSKMMLRINVNGFDRLILYDFTGNKIIETPAKFNYANVTAVRFSNYENKVIIGYNSAVLPGTLWEWNWDKDTVIQLTYPSFASIPKEIFVEPEIIKYRSFDDLEISSFLYMPKYYDKSRKIPVIISVHGGPEGQASYGFNSTLQFYLSSGYAVAEPNVRGSTGYGKKFTTLDDVKLRENSVKDIEYLVKELTSRGDIDKERIVVTGGSYGGYMVLACLTNYPDMFAAGISTVGISNFITFLKNTADYRRAHRESEYGSLEKDSSFLASISPVNKVDRIKKPIMFIHGRNDPRVPVGEAIQMHEALIKRGINSELLIYEDEGHGLGKMKNRMDAYPKMIKFLNEVLK